MASYHTIAAGSPRTESWKYGLAAGIIGALVVLAVSDASSSVTALNAQSVVRPVVSQTSLTMPLATHGATLAHGPIHAQAAGPMQYTTPQTAQGYTMGDAAVPTHSSMASNIMIVAAGAAALASAVFGVFYNRPASIAMASSTGKFESAGEQAAYGIGLQLGTDIISQPFEGLTVEAVCAGIADGMNKATPQLDQATLRDAFEQVQTLMKAEEEKKWGKNLEEGNNFMMANTMRDEVVQTESGLQYEVVTKGDGESPQLGSTVQVHYKGTLLDGSQFDSSYDRGQPAEFPVNRVIKGWTEALQLMTVGSKWKLFIPHYLAYGEKGAPPSIPPFSMLTFEVELLKITS